MEEDETQATYGIQVEEAEVKEAKSRKEGTLGTQNKKCNIHNNGNLQSIPMHARTKS